LSRDKVHLDESKRGNQTLSHVTCDLRDYQKWRLINADFLLYIEFI